LRFFKLSFAWSTRQGKRIPELFSDLWVEIPVSTDLYLSIEQREYHFPRNLNALPLIEALRLSKTTPAPPQK
jgi:hypothetical protein